MRIAMFQGYGEFGRYRRRRRTHRRGRRGSSKLGRAAKHCKGKTKGKFRQCVKKFMKSRR